MIQLTFDGLFRTTEKGLPDTSSMPVYSYVSLSYFVYSLLIEILICLIVCGFVGLTVYRVFFKIKNKKFFPKIQEKEDDDEKSSIKSKSKTENSQAQNTADNLIYRFDEDDQESEKSEQKEYDSDQDEQENYDDQQNANEEIADWFLTIDQKILYLQPYLIGFIVASNAFAAGIFVFLFLISALICFFLFNLKNYSAKYTLLQYFFIIPCILAFIPMFMEDLSMSS